MGRYSEGRTTVVGAGPLGLPLCLPIMVESVAVTVRVVVMQLEVSVKCFLWSVCPRHLLFNVAIFLVKRTFHYEVIQLVRHLLLLVAGH